MHGYNYFTYHYCSNTNFKRTNIRQIIKDKEVTVYYLLRLLNTMHAGYDKHNNIILYIIYYIYYTRLYAWSIQLYNAQS